MPLPEKRTYLKTKQPTIPLLLGSIYFHQPIGAASYSSTIFHHDSPRSRRLCQQTRCWSHPSPSQRWCCTRTLQYPPHFQFSTWRRLSSKGCRKTPSVMDNQTFRPGDKRGRTSSGGHRLYMLHKGARHGSPAAERRCRCEDVGFAMGKNHGWCQPLCRAYVGFSCR